LIPKQTNLKDATIWFIYDGSSWTVHVVERAQIDARARQGVRDPDLPAEGE
jgi:hypothetical protein